MTNLGEQLRQVPFVRLTIALLAGIWWQSSFLQLPFHTLPLAFIFLSTYFLLLALPVAKKYNRQWMTGCCALLFLFFTGTTLIQQQTTASSLPMQELVTLYAEISDAPVENERSIKLLATVEAYADSNAVQHAVHEKIFLYVAPDSNFALPEAGTHIIVSTRLSPIPPPQNPAEFDYKNYLAGKQIFASAFIHSNECQIDHTRSTWSKIRYFPLKVQQKALRTFEQSTVSGDEYAVLAALTLGNKQLLNDDLRTAYSSAGVMHLLAVSGLHVGIIMAVLGFMFSFLGKKRNGKIFKNALIIFCLWFYAAIVGFSPSVTRATVMFTFVLLGQMSQRRISIYNSLAASAFFLCIINPLLLFDIGFQLSYGAVLSIVYFQPPLQRLWYIKNKFLNAIWGLATVSFAAQIGTLPITLLYFHQFPNYFLLANVSVITLTAFIVYTAVVFLAVSAVPYLSDIVSHILNAMLWLLNHIVRFVEALPYSLTQHIYLNHRQAFLLLLIILSIALYMANRRRPYLWAAAYLFVIMLGIGSWHHAAQKEQEIFAVYNVKNTSFIHLISGHRNMALLDRQRPSKDYAYNLNNYFTEKGVRMVEYMPLDTLPLKETFAGNTLIYKDFVVFRNQLIKILQDEKISRNTTSIETDYLVVTGKARMYPTNALHHYHPKQIILDASIPFYRAKQWTAAALVENIPLHNVREQGAFILER